MTAPVLVLGLDGATFDLIEPWAAAGELPAFAELMAAGARGRLRTVPNTDTAPAWTSFATGLRPANHGLFHEYGWDEARRTLRQARGGDRQGLPLWELASAAGRRVVAVNVPFSYPVEPVDGAVVAGIDAPGPGAPGFCHPPGFLAEVEARFGPYRIDSQITLAIKRGKPTEGLAAAYAVAEQHTATLLYALEQRPWDLAVLVYSIPDEMQHFFWQAMRRREGPQRDAILDGYRFIDRQLARLRAVAGPDASLIVFSDHGFGPICATTQYLADWLRQAGFLRMLDGGRTPLAQRLVGGAYGWLRQRLGEGLKEALRRGLPALRSRVESDVRFAGINWAGSRAFVASSPNEIWVNLRGREPRGSVAPGAEYERTCAEITAALRSWRDGRGRPRVRAVYRREEVYAGRFLHLAPDLTIEWDPEAAPLAAELPGNFSCFDADHQPDGVLLAAGPGIRAGAHADGAELPDLAPTILRLLGVAQPPCDGRVLEEILSPDTRPSAGLPAG